MRLTSTPLADSAIEHLTDTVDPFDRQRDGVEFKLTGRAATLFTYALTGVLAVWIFVYVSGLFPYLGRIAHVNAQGGVFMSRDSGLGTFAVPRAYLFKGQTIFIDYTVRVEGDSKVRIALEGAPAYRLAFWPRTHFDVQGAGTGRLTYTVPESGFYNVEASAFQWKGRYHINYEIVWGAVWAGGALPTTEAQARQMPAQPASGPFQPLPPSLAP